MVRKITFMLLLVFSTVSGHAQKAYASGGYMVIDAAGMPPTCIVNRKTEGFLILGRLHRHHIKEYKPGGSSANARLGPNYRVSKKFRVSPTDVAEDGSTDAAKVSKGGTWAGFAGWHANNNATLYSAGEGETAATGCSAYEGKDGMDDPGTWRLPSQKELMLIGVFSETLERGKTSTGFEPFNSSTTTITYLSATEYTSGSGTSTAYYCYAIPWKTRLPSTGSKLPKRAGSTVSTPVTTFRARCIQDID